MWCVVTVGSLPYQGAFIWVSPDRLRKCMGRFPVRASSSACVTPDHTHLHRLSNESLAENCWDGVTSLINGTQLQILKVHLHLFYISSWGTAEMENFSTINYHNFRQTSSIVCLSRNSLYLNMIILEKYLHPPLQKWR